MPSMIDVQCRCGKRFGWCGTMANQPECPRCGYRPPQEQLDKAEAEMQEVRERLLTHPAHDSADVRRMQRIDAGLSLRQAAKLLGINPFDLSCMENGTQEVSPELAQLMAKVYGVGPTDTA